MIHGENLILAIGGTPLAASKTCNVNKAQSFIETSDPTSGRWEAFVPGKLGWAISSECLLATTAAYKTLDAAWKAGTALTIRFYDTEYNENETGTAYIEKLDLVATKGSLAKMSISLRGSGALTEYKVEIPMTLVANKQIGYYLTDHQGHPMADVSQEDGTLKVYTITLAEQTLCDFILGQADIVVIGGDHILEEVDRELPIYLDFDASYWGSTNLRVNLAAGTHYVLFSLIGQTEITTAKVYKVS